MNEDVIYTKTVRHTNTALITDARRCLWKVKCTQFIKTKDQQIIHVFSTSKVG